MADEFIAHLPAGYDGRTRLALRDDNQVIATHPEHPALVLGTDGHWHDLLRAGSPHQAADPSAINP